MKIYSLFLCLNSLEIKKVSINTITIIKMWHVEEINISRVKKNILKLSILQMNDSCER